MPVIERLPVELKLEILLNCTFTRHGLFNLCKAIPRFQQVYNEYERVIQTALQKKHGYSPELIQLIDRFRLTETGMSDLSLQIFASVNRLPRDAGLEYYEFRGKAIPKPPKSKTDICIIDCEQIRESRKAFSKTNGVLGSIEEAVLLKEIQKYVDFLYRVIWKIGARSHLARQKTFEQRKYRDPLVKRIRKAIVQFLIATTHFHGQRWQLPTGCRDGPDVNIRPYCNHLGLSTDGLLRSPSFHGEEIEGYASILGAPIVLDFTYLASLSMEDFLNLFTVMDPLIGERGVYGSEFVSYFQYRPSYPHNDALYYWRNHFPVNISVVARFPGYEKYDLMKTCALFRETASSWPWADEYPKLFQELGERLETFREVLATEVVEESPSTVETIFTTAPSAGTGSDGRGFEEVIVEKEILTNRKFWENLFPGRPFLLFGF